MSTAAPTRRPTAKRTSARPVAPKPVAKAAAVPSPKPAPAVKKTSAAKVMAPIKEAVPLKPAKTEKPAKVRRKPVRDSFTMPEADFGLIATLKARALSAKRETKKSELLRAGLHALAALPTPALVAALDQLDPVKIGRPKQG